MKDVTLASSFSEESKGAIDEVDLIIGDTSALKRIESSSEERKEMGIRLVSSSSSQPPHKEVWCIEDKTDMSQFKELVPNPAISYPFELDDF
jgi:hypothetical protein